jgi:hypothetical protein
MGVGGAFRNAAPTFRLPLGACQCPPRATACIIPGVLQKIQPLEVCEGMRICRLHGRHSLVEAVDHISRAIAECRRTGGTQLLVDVTGIEDIPVPTLVDRFLMVEDWAQAAQSMVVVAMVAHSRYIHPRKFGVTVAAHLGLTCDVYTSEEAATKWLRAADIPAGRAAG